MVTIGTPQSMELIKPESIKTIQEEGVDGYSYTNSGLVVKAGSQYQATENWAIFEIIEVRFYNQALAYSIIFDTLIMLAWRLHANES